jgi:hypothetical protein
MARRRPVYIARAAVLAMAWLSFIVAAQSVDDEDESTPDEEVVDEIVVVVDRDGDPVFDVDMRQEEILREKVFNEYFRLQALEEEAAWRRADPDLEIKDSSRIKWGYNPQAEARMRRDTELTDLPIDTTKPATVFRVEF